MKNKDSNLNKEDPTPKPEGESPVESHSTASFIPLTAIKRAPSRLDLGAIRKRLAGKKGSGYWRSLEELAETEEFAEYLSREFPHQSPVDWEPVSRRSFMKLMGASLALAGAVGCSYQPAEKIVPFVKQPEDIVPGRPLYFATSALFGGYARGLLAESHEGRPTKLEGNPQHPASLGATDAITQGTLLTLYDPDRSQSVRKMGDLTTWDTLLGAISTEADKFKAKRGEGLTIVTETVTSPTLASQLQAFQQLYPLAKWRQFDPAGRDNVRAGARLAFGEEVETIYRFDKAKRIVALDSNFLIDEPGSVRYARDFSDGRRVREGQYEMNRLYAVESMPTVTGSSADHRLPLKSSSIEGFARALASALGVPGAGDGAIPPGVPTDWIPALAKDLKENRGASVIIAGPQQPPVVHALAHAMNDSLGNVGQTVIFAEPIAYQAGDQGASLKALVEDMSAGRVETLIFLGGVNPVYAAPSDLRFADSMKKVPLLIHHGLYDDETGVQCHWHVPESHYLEAWSDARAYDGTTGIVQPLIQPIYDSKSIHEVLAALLGQGDLAGYDLVRGYWQSQKPGATFNKFWQEAVYQGMLPDSASKPKAVRFKPSYPESTAASGFEINFRPDPNLWDGRYANNGWLQELPKPLTHITWDNVAHLSPKTAEAMKLSNGDVVSLAYGGGTVKAPVWVMPGHAEDSVTVHLGFGRLNAGKLGTDVGFNASLIRTSDAPWIGSGVEIKKVSSGYPIADTQKYYDDMGRDLFKAGNVEDLKKNPKHPEFMGEAENPDDQANLYPQMWPSDRKGEDSKGVPTYKGEGYNGEPIPAWGMVIDNNACIGCNACVIACQSENNISTVGKDQVLKRREMHWLRIDTYYKGDLENPETFFEPVPCMHCEKAPCELVCPVEATTHSVEGINEMTYNRCVGTRYCSNNCPYKVRRFNFLQYADQQSPTIQLVHNPDVTVRSRGVMEKCSYCIQRINESRIQAEKEDRPIQDGEVRTACQQVCPTQAITFGNINDLKGKNGKGSEVRQLKGEPLHFGLLTELNTKPRTTYLAKVKNPNPDIASAEAGKDEAPKAEG